MQLWLLFQTGIPEDLREATASPRRIGWAHLALAYSLSLKELIKA